MQFKTINLLIFIAAVSLPLGFVATYNANWASHCRKLEPSLFAFLLQEEIDRQVGHLPPKFEYEGVAYNSEPQAIEVYFALGKSNQTEEWISPTQKQMKAIGLESVLPVSETCDHNNVYYVVIVRWVDWNTVIVNYGSHGGPLSGSGSNNVKLQRTNDQWEIIDCGSAWLS